MQGVRGKVLWFLVATVTVVLAAVVISGCGCGASTPLGQSGQNLNVNPVPGVKGGTATFLTSGDVDYLDPGLSYYTFGYTVIGSTQRALYSYKAPNGTTPIPDLASAPPAISSDLKTITIKIRSGVHYSPPVNREVTSADVKYAIERAFSKNVPNSYVGLYFSSIQGAPAPGSGPITPISGLQTPDKYTLVIKLSAPSATVVSEALVLPISVPVPQEYAQKFDAQTPSTYNTNVVFSGPYMVRNNSAGSLVGYTPLQSIDLIRNPNWNPATDYRPAYLDAINIKEGNNNQTVATTTTLTGTSLMCCDSTAPPPSTLILALEHYKPQVGAFINTGAQYYVTLNTTIAPLNNLNVRKAIIAASDRVFLRKIVGGPPVGAIAQHLIPPGINGFTESGGYTGFKDLDYTQYPNGNMTLATKYMNLAAKDGVPITNGKYTGPAISAVSANVSPTSDQAVAVKAQFAKLGITLNLTQVPQSTMYTKFCEVPASKTGVCPSAGWEKDFSDPLTMLYVPFNGKSIIPAGNANFAELNDPKVNAAMMAAFNTPAGPTRWQQWANINHMIMADAPVIPLNWAVAYQTRSANVIGPINPYYTTWDLAFMSLK